MNVSAPFIARPVATSLMALALMILGMMGYRNLPVASLPQVAFPTIIVSTALPGASPQTTSALLTAPLERQLGQISSLMSMSSTSSFGLSQITLQFALERDIDGAAQDVQAAINAAASVLPRGLPYPPTYLKANPADAPIITLALTSSETPRRFLADIADTLIAQRLSEITGVGRVSVLGSSKPAVRVRVDVAALAALGLGFEDIRTAVNRANLAAPKGVLDGQSQTHAITANDQIATAAEYERIVVAVRNGQPVRLGDFATLSEGFENERLAASLDGKPAILIEVQRQPGANVIETVDRIRRLLPEIGRALPADAVIDVFSDRTGMIRASVHEVQLTLVLSVGLVIMVVLLFLRTWSATVIAGITLPLSMVGSFAVMWLAGFSLDNLSLMALTISVGFVVDDAIVMLLENIARHRERGAAGLAAATSGSREIGFTVVSLTMSLLAVFVPLLFMGGLVGRMFREFAITLAIAVVVSMVVSLTVTPMLAARLVKAGVRDDGSTTAGPHPPVGLSHRDRLCAVPGLRTPSSCHDAGRNGRDAGRDRLALRKHAERLPADAGYGTDQRCGQGHAGSFRRSSLPPSGPGLRCHQDHTRGRPRCCCCRGRALQSCPQRHRDDGLLEATSGKDAGRGSDRGGGARAPDRYPGPNGARTAGAGRAGGDAIKLESASVHPRHN